LDRIIHTKLVFTPIYMIVALEFLVCLRIGKLVVLDQAISSWKGEWLCIADADLSSQTRREDRSLCFHRCCACCCDSRA
jgi:hypothetical protein